MKTKTITKKKSKPEARWFWKGKPMTKMDDLCGAIVKIKSKKEAQKLRNGYLFAAGMNSLSEAKVLNTITSAIDKQFPFDRVNRELMLEWFGL